MISNLSEKIAKKLVAQNAIDNNDLELYHYGLFVILSELWLCLYTIAVGSVFRVTKMSLIFFIAFFLIRRYAGGLHAKTELQCQIISLSSLLLSILLAKYILMNTDGKYILVINLICFIITALLSPVDTFEKELSQSERKRFKSITFCIGSALLLLNYILFNFNIQFAYVGITTAYLLESVLLIFGKIFNKSKRRRALLDAEN